ncbi:hypothetical protein F4678DRAFT_185378 [Xylaria arbuscula]|nr:hypothetical protein F4678DRAFT_185378 [Xylaria arbuscula]
MSDARSGGEPARPSQHGLYSHPTVPKVEDFGDTGQGNGQDTGIQDLIQFLKKTPPPPTNYMSEPDNFNSGSEDDTWDRFKKTFFRYRRKVRKRKRRPPVIMLPDSAVSARTTGGHRYIAISIPTQHSPLAPLPSAQYPIYDSIETAFQREANSMFGIGKKPPPSRPVTVLNPVAEDRESMSSSSHVSERQEKPTGLTSPSRRARSHSIPLLPSQEQRFTLRGDPAKRRSASSVRSARSLSDPAARKDTKVTEPTPTRRILERPVITLTLPPRKSSRRGKGLEVKPPVEKVISPSIDSPGASPEDSNGNGNGNGSGGSSNGERTRGSFAASIETTGSSPQLLKAQTAVAFQSVPIVVKPADSPEDINPPKPVAEKEKAGLLPQIPPAGPPPPLASEGEDPQHRKKSVRERTQAVHKGKGKGKEPAQEPFTPDMPTTSPKWPPSGSPLEHHHHEAEGTSSTPTSTTEPPSGTSSASTHGRGFPSARSFSRRKRGREERHSRYIAKALAEERETLERLPREELIQRYEALREQRVYERERRLRRLERSRDTWIRAVPVLLQDLNGLLREQHRILEGARQMYAFPGAPPPEHQGRRRSRSVEVSSGSLSSGRGVDPLETRRSQSVYGSSEPRSGHKPSGLPPG